ncbi:MAG: hypothetical protein AWU59_1015 [Methanolobus sp. T82-4]|nr:MAG: hypothetical protein AWU59_1015 [Methanolobus sp. T82-4]
MRNPKTFTLIQDFKNTLKINIKNQQPELKINAFVFGLYVILTLIMVWLPLSIDLRKTYIGQGEVVWWSNLFWWAEYTISHLMNPFHNSLVFYPIGMDTLDSILPIFLFVPITYIFGSVLSYNIYVLSSFFLAGYGMFILSKYIYKDIYASFIVGLIFAFFPFHFGASISHVHSFSIMWIPFFVYYLLKMYDSPTKTNIFLASLFFAMNALTSWTIAVMLSIFCIIYAIYYRNKTFSKNFFSKLLMFIVLSVCLMFPALLLIVKNVADNENMVLPLVSFLTFSADIVGFVLPSPFNPILGDFSNQFYSTFTGNYTENVVSIGYSVLILAFIGIYNYKQEKFNRFALLSFISFLIISLGPALHINGNIRFTEHELTIMLPGILTYFIPVFNMIRVPSRYHIMTMFSISLICGYGLQYIFEKLAKSNKNKIIACCLISCLILFEFSAVIPTQEVKQTPDFYYSITKTNNDPIIEIPVIRSPLESPYGAIMMYYYEYQKIHGKPIMGGYFNRVNVIYESFMEQDPNLQPLFNGPDEEALKNTIFDPTYLTSNYNVSYIVIHKSFLSEVEVNSFVSYLGDDYSIDNSVKSDKLIIYNLNNNSTKKKL